MFIIDTAPATQVREHFKDYCDDVERTNKALIVTRRDKPQVVVVSFAEYNRQLNNERYLAKLRRSREELDNGEGQTMTPEELDAF